MLCVCTAKKRPGNRLPCSRDDKSLIAVPPGFTQTRALVRAPTSPCPGNGGKAVPPYRKPSLGRPAPAPAAIPPAYRLAPPAGSLKAAPVWHNAFHAFEDELVFQFITEENLLSSSRIAQDRVELLLQNCELFLLHRWRIREEPLILGCGPQGSTPTASPAQRVAVGKEEQGSGQMTSFLPHA